ncbi:MAG: hypothetical protein H6741_06985 [Alphaproteobacteria bacterium]|nr:hypothetical protein [Alphaproteobacteria bacterium]
MTLTLLALFACTKSDDVIDSEPTSLVDLDLITSSDRPSKRSEIYGIADEPSSTIVIFGGNDGPIVDQRPTSTFRDDTWVFEAGVGWSELPIQGPLARGRYGATYDPVNRRALIFGGRYRVDGGSGDYTLFDDLAAFNFEDRTWEQLDIGGGPSPRYYPSLAFDADTETLYLYGGITSASAMTISPDAELWKWTEAGGWEEIQTSGDRPSQRTFLGEAWDPVRKRLVIFHGQVGDFWSLAYNETYAVDVATGEWTLLNDGAGAPSTRMHAHATYDALRDRYLLFGGHTDIGDGNDLWAMDPETGAWSEVRPADTFTGEGLGCLGNPSEVPADYVDMDVSAPERRHRGMFALMHDSLWIYGGMHAECSDQLDDTWRYPLDGSGDWTQLIEARTGEACERRNDDCECLCY